MNKGKFIVIEGSDGAGKKTQADELMKALTKDGYDLAYYDFPQYSTSFFGAMVGRYLNGEFGGVDDVSPYLSSVLFAGDRFEAAEKMHKDLTAGKIIIANRYMQSNLAFQSAKLADESAKQQFRDWLNKLEYDIFKIPAPDIIVYLSLPYIVSQQLVDKKSKRDYTAKKRDIHEDNAGFLARVEKEYLALAKNEANWRLVECCENNQLLSIATIAEKVYKLINKELKDGGK